jgi:KaiC/GvpD/RAD55 family RecA-like ATPase
MRFDLAIISGLITNEKYCRKVLPFLSEEYFGNKEDKIILNMIHEFVLAYNKAPNKKILEIEAEKKKLISLEYEALKTAISEIDETEVDAEWLTIETEKFCKEKALYNAIVKSVHIAHGEDDKHTPDAIPSILQDALSVCFDTSVGHDYIDDAESRYEYYHDESEKIPFDLDYFNLATKNGLTRKTLSSIMGYTGAGKSQVLCHFAASYLKQGYNVLYITLELSEKVIASRIDANLMGIDIHDLQKIDREKFTTNIGRIKNKTAGKLIIKEYPSGTAHAGHFDALIAELKTKRDFEPDIFVVDYIGECASQRVKNTASTSYTIQKSIASELRALCCKHDMVGWTANQTTRGGAGNSDVEQTDVADSFGVIHVLDFFVAIIRTEELDEMKQVMMKVLKSRMNDLNKYKRFVIGVDMGKMKYYNLEESATDELVLNKAKKIKDNKPTDEPPPAYISAKPKSNTSGFKF